MSFQGKFQAPRVPEQGRGASSMPKNRLQSTCMDDSVLVSLEAADQRRGVLGVVTRISPEEPGFVGTQNVSATRKKIRAVQKGQASQFSGCCHRPMLAKISCVTTKKLSQVVPSAWTALRVACTSW